MSREYLPFYCPSVIALVMLQVHVRLISLRPIKKLSEKEGE